MSAPVVNMERVAAGQLVQAPAGFRRRGGAHDTLDQGQRLLRLVSIRDNFVLCALCSLVLNCASLADDELLEKRLAFRPVAAEVRQRGRSVAIIAAFVSKL